MGVCPLKDRLAEAAPPQAWPFPLRRFIEEKSSFEYGQVNHALAAAMRTLVKEHLVLVTQLEQLQRQGLLSLQKLWFYVQPATRTMHILASIGTHPATEPCRPVRAANLRLGWSRGQEGPRARGPGICVLLLSPGW